MLSAFGTRPIDRARLMLISLAFALFSPPPPALAQAQATWQILNFRDADIRSFIEDVSMLTGRAFIVAPLVQGKVTVVSERPLPPDAVFEVFLSTLRVHGFAALPTASGAWRIVKEEAAAAGAAAGEGFGDRFVTEVFHLDHAEAPVAMRAIQGLVDPAGRTIGQPGTDYLIVVDYAANMPRIRQVLDDIDRDRSVSRTLRLSHVTAGEMAALAERLANEGGGEGTRRRSVIALPLESGNSLVLKGNAEAVEALAATVLALDAEAASRGTVRVRALNHADAKALVPILQEVSRQPGVASDAPGAGQRASIAVHEPSNSLIIAAEPALLLSLEQVIDRLDRRRAQVLVEAIIVEISDNAARDLGLQYVLAGGEGSNIPFTATNFSQTAPNILAAAGAIAVGEEQSGGSDVLDGLQQAAVNSLLGVGGFLGGFAGLTDNGTLFGVILTALQQDTSSNILSTPHVMTMDNEEASIIVGQEVPITTGEVVGSDFVNPFRTVQRRDVGIQLEVKPQINDGDSVRLVIRQEVSSVLGPASAQSGELIFNKREIATTVTVDDGEIVVLGGLIEDNERVSLQKVPFLGDIPLLGALFRSESKSRAKTNLMVFLRPTIVRDRDRARAVTDRKYDLMRAEELLRKEEGTPSALDSFLRDVIGAEPGSRQ